MAQDLGARLAGRDLELCALEALASASKAQEDCAAEALRTAQEEAKCLGGMSMVNMVSVVLPYYI